MSKKKLFNDDSDEDIAIKTENEYAKKYDTWREKEEIYKLEQKYGTKALNPEGSEDSDSEDESDESLEVNEEVETQFLKTLSLLKTKDPRIYDPSYKCFDIDEEKKPDEKEKPKTLTFDDSDDDDDGGDIFKIEKKAEIDEQDDKNESSSKKNEKKEKIKEYLTGKAEHIGEDVEKDLAPLKALWSDPKLNEGEAFLRDYILNKRYLEEGEVGEAEDRLRDDADLEADEHTVDEQNKFERAYNFRFEEPDDEYLKRFPRTMSTVRPKDDRRARKRAEVRERKAAEKARRMDEVARLKALKLKDIKDKIAKIKEVTGNEELAFKDEDIEGDFDPEEHDRRMRALFDEQYYGDVDHEKPVFPDLDEELEIENWDKYDVDNAEAQVGGARAEGPHCEDDDFNMDADYEPNRARANLLEEIQKTLGKKKRARKRKSKLAEALAVKKPKFLPDDEKTYSQYMDEYYAMDCEDIVGGDLPTRFKYREVVPNDYGLTVEEILLADDKELTQWVPLKKIVKHKGEAAQRGEVAAYRQRAADVRLKQKMLPSLFRDLPEEPELVVPVDNASKKKKKKKSKEKKNDDDNVQEDPELNINENVDENGDDEQVVTVNSKKNKNRKPKTENIPNGTENDQDIPEGHKKKKRKTSKSENVDANSNLENEMTSPAVKSNKNKKGTTSTSENEDIHCDLDNELTPAVKSNKKKKIKNLPSNEDTETILEVDKQDNNLANKNNKRKNKPAAFVVEEVPNQGPSQEANVNSDSLQNNKNKKTQLNENKFVGKPDSNRVPQKNKQGLGKNKKNKKDSKTKFKAKDKFKHKTFNKNNNDKSNDNPLSKLSDERLKAYGLNPKKYKNFLKYKKF